MRQLKFRICYTDLKDDKYIFYDDKRFMIGLDGSVLEDYCKPYGAENSCWEVTYDVWTHPFIQQFTGVVDKNGVDIYEGDYVMQYSNKILEVKWMKAYSGEQWCLCDPKYPNEPDDFYGGLGDNLTVVGNNFLNTIEELNEKIEIQSLGH